jgi:hypothetical protein
VAGRIRCRLSVIWEMFEDNNRPRRKLWGSISNAASVVLAGRSTVPAMNYRRWLSNLGTKIGGVSPISITFCFARRCVTPVKKSIVGAARGTE